MKHLTVLAKITAPHLNPQSYEHIKHVIEQEFNRHGVIVEIYDTEEY